MSNQDKPTGQTYELRTVQDFAALTPRQREHAAKDFLLWLRYVTTAEMMGESTEGLVTMTADTSVFRWVDDGEHVATMNMVGPEGKAYGTFTRDHGSEFDGEGE